jgi:hypothetical protein
MDIFHSVVISTLVYGLDTLVPTNRDLQRLRRCYDKLLGESIGLDAWTSPWGDRVPFNAEEIRRLTWTEDFATLLARARLRLAGRVKRAQPEHPIHAVQRSDEWWQQIRNDCRTLQMEEQDLGDAWRMEQIIHRKNHYIRSKPNPTPYVRELEALVTAQKAVTSEAVAATDPVGSRKRWRPSDASCAPHGDIPLQQIIRTKEWKDCIPANFASPREAVMFLQERELKLGSCDLDYDTAKGKKTGIKRGLPFSPNQAGIFIICEGILAIDLDGPSIQAQQLVQLLDGRCNMVAITRKGAHLVFNAHQALSLNHTFRDYQIDIRTGDKGILLVEPSYYNTDTTTVYYRWWRIPRPRQPLMDLPQECADLILSWRQSRMGKAKRGRTR